MLAAKPCTQHGHKGAQPRTRNCCTLEGAPLRPFATSPEAAARNLPHGRETCLMIRGKCRERSTPEAGQRVALYQDVHLHRVVKLASLIPCPARACQCGIGTALNEVHGAAEGEPAERAD